MFSFGLSIMLGHLACMQFNSESDPFLGCPNIEQAGLTARMEALSGT